MNKALVIALLLLVLGVGPLMASSEVIIDNTSAAIYGAWTTNTSATDKYGTSYLQSVGANPYTKYVTYTPNLGYTASDWQVYVWFPTISKANASCQLIVHTQSGDTTVTFSETAGMGSWVYIGTYAMSAGTGNYVRITNQGSSTKNVAADAVRFYSASAGDVTPPVISNVQATSISSGSAVITWTTDEAANSQVDYGLTSSYGSQTTKDAALVTSHSVTVSGLTPSTTYHYRVRSEDGTANLALSGDYTFTTAAATPEFRFMWLNTWNTATYGHFMSASGITQFVNTCYNNNYNVLIPEVRKCGDAYYNSAYEPRATNITDPLPFDPMQDCINKAHALGMEVHPWIVAYRIWASSWGTAPSYHIWYQHPEWAMKTSAGSTLDGSYYNLDPGVPGVQDYIAKVVIDIITKYDVDGINYDYIRYPGTDWGYNEITKQRFYNEYGYNPPTASTDPNWGVWCNFRRQQVTDLVKKLYLEIIWRKPHVKMGVDTVGWLAGNPVTDFTTTRAYYDVFQDSDKWTRDHILDVNLLMNYKREYDSLQAPDYDLWTDWLQKLQTQYGRHGADGQAAYLNAIADSVHQMGVARTRGVGIGNYDYITTNKDSQPASSFFDAVKTGIYQSFVPTPDMPWKSNPTTGVIFGTVTDASHPNDPIYQNWVYKADVTATGPVTRTTQTDGTGTYGFMDLPPGTYNITVSKSGFVTRTYTAQLLRAGDVVREDFDLGTVTATSPAGTIMPGWSWFSLPLEPVDPAPESVLTGLAIDGNLFRWDSPTLSQVMYDMWRPDIFGPLTVGDGYLYRTEDTTPYTISYTAYSGSPAMKSLSLPYAGWALIGCPFTREANWENALVTKDGVTTDLRTASQYGNNWISSTGFWWNNAEQSQYDIGLPEDWPSGGTTLVPWRGYWISTFQDGLTLTIR